METAVIEKREFANRFDLRDMKKILIIVTMLTVDYNMQTWSTMVKSTFGQPVCSWRGTPYDASFDYSYMWMGPWHTVRHILVAYGLLRGLHYTRMEKTSRDQPDAGLILSVIKKFAPAEFADQWDFERVRRSLHRDQSDV